MPSIALVHPVLTLGAYGLPEGVCSSYHVRFGPERELVWREAAMVRAVQLATGNSSACNAGDESIKTPDLSKPVVLPIRWTIRNDVTEKHASVYKSAKTSDAKVKSTSASNDQKLAYVRLEAGSLVKYHVVPPPTEGKFVALKDAIVVIGSTAQWSEDTLATPLGDLQGVLAHVNFALSLQSVDDEASVGLQFLLDFVLAGVAALATVYWCWRPAFQALPLGPAPHPSAASTLHSGSGRVCGVRTSFRIDLRFAAVSRPQLPCRLALWNSQFDCGSYRRADDRGLSAIADAMRDFVEGRITRRSHLRPNIAQQRRASIGSPREPSR